MTLHSASPAHSQQLSIIRVVGALRTVPPVLRGYLSYTTPCFDRFLFSLRPVIRSCNLFARRNTIIHQLVCPLFLFPVLFDSYDPLSRASFLFRRRLEWDRVAKKTAHRKTRDPERLPTNSRPAGHVKADLLPSNRFKEVYRTTKKQASQLLE